MVMFDAILPLINDATRVVIIQGENPDGDSLGTSLALEELLGNIGKEVTMYCAIDMPKYLRYIDGWDRVVNDFAYDADIAIIVDTAAEALIEKCLRVQGVRAFLESHPVVVLDHHGEDNDEEPQNDLSFEHEFVLSPTAAATGELVYELATIADWHITKEAATAMYASIMSDTLGLTTQAVTPRTFQVATDLVSAGAAPYEIETKRREFMKKPADILTFKGELISRVEYQLDQRLATVHITWDDIREYSDRYNPSILVLDEMRLVENVAVACAIKTYPDGKLTGKLRCNLPVASMIAGYFGGGGHEYAAGFKVHEDYDTIMHELVDATAKALEEYHAQTT